jgi:hypothetical protein
MMLQRCENLKKKYFGLLGQRTTQWRSRDAWTRLTPTTTATSHGWMGVGGPLKRRIVFVFKKTVWYVLRKTVWYVLRKTGWYVLRKTGWIRLDKDGFGTSLKRRIGRFFLKKNGYGCV